MIVTIKETPGRCRWCGCTDEMGCALGCSWANRDHTLCTGCVGLDKQVRTREGRQALAELVQESEATSL